MLYAYFLERKALASIVLELQKLSEFDLAMYLLLTTLILLFDTEKDAYSQL